MKNSNEKRPLEPRDREYIIFALDKAYEQKESLSQHVGMFDEFDITQKERNRIILDTEFRNDEKLVSMLTLFG